MERKDYTGIIPVQYTGKEIEAKAHVDFDDENAAIAFYTEAKNRLLNVNKWHELAGVLSARFQLIDTNGREVDRNAEKNDYFKIDIPGPGSSEGNGYDWVRVEEVKEINEGHIESIGFRVRPSQNPFTNKNEIAHFYSEDATSNFIVIRDGRKVIAWIVDRNIKPNDTPGSLTDKIRDTYVGIGAMTMFSKAQWQSLANAIVNQTGSVNA